MAIVGKEYASLNFTVTLLNERSSLLNNISDMELIEREEMKNRYVV